MKHCETCCQHVTFYQLRWFFTCFPCLITCLPYLCYNSLYYDFLSHFTTSSYMFITFYHDLSRFITCLHIFSSHVIRRACHISDFWRAASQRVQESLTCFCRFTSVSEGFTAAVKPPTRRDAHAHVMYIDG